MGLTVAKTDGQWLIAEASLDSMLEAYTKRQGAGDDFFIPIVKNPQGGDSLALFFGFNEDALSKRSARQLQMWRKPSRWTAAKSWKSAAIRMTWAANATTRGFPNAGPPP